MAISYLGRVVGAAQGVLHLVNGEGEEAKKAASSEAYHPVTPEQLVVQAEGQDAAGRVHDVLSALSGEGTLGAALTAIKPELSECVCPSEEDADLLNWLRLFKHFKQALADGKLDAGERSTLLAELGDATHAGDLAKNWFDGLVSKVTGKGGKAKK